MHKIIFFIFLLLMFSCKQRQLKEEMLSFKDSVVNRYFALIDSAEFHDTINNDFRVLKAYINNDSVFFVKMNEQMDQGAKALKENPRLDSCVSILKISNLKADEVYRFSHGQSFCYYGQRITITRTEDSISLHYIEYGNGEGSTIRYTNSDGTVNTVKPYCFVAKEFNRPLSLKDWESLEVKIKEADSWGLKHYHYDLSTDGSSWRIEAYTKQPKEPEGQQINFVSRHCSCNTAFKELGNCFLKLSGEKTMCGEFF